MDWRVETQMDWRVETRMDWRVETHTKWTGEFKRKQRNREQFDWQMRKGRRGMDTAQKTKINGTAQPRKQDGHTATRMILARPQND